MANINIIFNGKEFLLSCDDGQEEHLKELAEQINKKFASLKSELGNIGENKLLLITSIKIMDEYFETKNKIEEKKKELNDLSNKFKELRSLVYQYKDEKEKEIEVLRENQANFREEIEKNKEVYEKIIDDAANQIETFIQKANSDNQIQQKTVLKSNIRKKILKIRKNKNNGKIEIKFKYIYDLLKRKIDLKQKIVGGYFPVKHEVDDIKILKEFEKKK